MLWSLLVTLDVTSLYTNIPNQEGIRACTKALVHGRPAHLPSIPSLMMLLRMVLTMNNFEFNGDHYLQVGGTAMGTRLVTSYANLFMSDFKDIFVFNQPHQPLWWKRFIDDISVLWMHGKSLLDNFITHLNFIHSTIKFTAHISETSVEYLDTVVRICIDNTIITDLYIKPTDSHNYPHYPSCHPQHKKTSLPYIVK